MLLIVRLFVLDLLITLVNNGQLVRAKCVQPAEQTLLGHYFRYYSAFSSSLFLLLAPPEGVAVGLQIFGWAPK